MIRLVTGTVVSTLPHAVIVETVSGIGYLVTVPSRLLLVAGEPVRLYTHLAVRETALDLYGFLEVSELECFELLLTISGIGPKSAIQILDQASKDLIYEAARLEDPTHLHKLSGISKKTAEKIILGLKDKISDDMVVPTTTKEDTTMYQDAFDTLVTLGYNPLSVRQVLEATPTAVSTSALVTAALRQLSS